MSDNLKLLRLVGSSGTHSPSEKCAALVQPGLKHLDKRLAVLTAYTFEPTRPYNEEKCYGDLSLLSAEC